VGILAPLGVCCGLRVFGWVCLGLLWVMSIGFFFVGAPRRSLFILHM
jgi:hypothetical protein